MALSEEEREILREARELRATPEWQNDYLRRVEESRRFHEELAERRIPSDARMSERFTI